MGKTPFRGTPGEVMHQHLHAPLPLEELEGVPQPVVVLLEALLEKDPRRRFQDPGDLLKAIATITGRIETGRRITRDDLHKRPPATAAARTRRSPSKPGPKKISIARLPVTGSDLFGREEGHRFSGSRLGKQGCQRGLPSSLGPVSESRHSLTIGSDEWLRTIIVLQS